MNGATQKMVQNVINGTTPPVQATKAIQDGNGDNIVNTYAKQNGNYPNMTVGNATSADTASQATQATQDGSGNNIVNTYATKTELTEGLAGKQPTGNYALQNGSYPDMTVGNATNAGQVAFSLTFGEKTYDGSSAQQITAEDLGLGAAYKPQGSIAFADLPTPSASNLGYMWNITDSFTTDSRFVEGAGLSYSAGTNVGVIQSGSAYYLDVFGNFVDLSNYAQINGTYSGMTVGNATNATNATNAANATNASSANKVANPLTIVVDGVSTEYDGSSAETVNITSGGAATGINISIPTTKWTSNSATLTASDYPDIAEVTASSIVQFYGADSSAAAIITNDVALSSQGAGTLTFSCATAPSAAITGLIIIL